jgi:GTP-binding protein
MSINIRNIAIIAHVDHGKTTLVDKLLQGTGSVNERDNNGERMMDSNDLEKERGITILAKNTCVYWKDIQVNIVDTPGHADFGGEVERILSMVDSVLLLVDAVDGPMPQTRFVTQKAFAQGLNPIVCINKIDRPGARPDWVLDQVFDLFAQLNATDEQLDFPVIYASALNGYAKLDLNHETDNMNELLDLIIDKVPEPEVELDGPFQMQISALDYSSYVGTIGIGRITRGKVTPKMPLVVIDKDGNTRKGRPLQILGFKGLERIEVEEAQAGNIIAITGIDPLNISDTLCAPE